MRIRAKPWLFLPLLALTTAVIFFSIDFYRHRFVRSDADMLALLPKGDVTTFFADIAQLRRAGMVSLLAGSRAGGDPEYTQFVRQTRFDYERDIEAIGAVWDGEQIFFVVRGRFDWSKLRQYAVAHGGSCSNNVCSAPTSKPGRWASFFSVQPDVMALALSADRAAVHILRPAGRKAVDNPPAKPIWLSLSKSLLKNPGELPPAARIFAISLQSADAVLLSVDRTPPRDDAAFDLQLEAQFPNQAAAETARNQLQIQTRMLELGLARSNQQPNPADLSGLVTAGTFQAIGKRVIGNWPVRKELLNALQ